MLPDPNISFTLPSLHDGTLLDCRVYLPRSVLAVASNDPDARMCPKWQGHAAIIAHPYAPMGGSYDDQIVKLIGNRLLLRPKKSAAEQFVVATFNFRGAGRSSGRSGGRTSWTAKPEIGDYASVAGFLYYFVHFLDPYGDKQAKSLEEVTPSTTLMPDIESVFLFAGYSYGAMVTTLLPPLSEILVQFSQPARDGAAAEIRRRSSRLASGKNAEFSECRAAIAEAEAAKTAANTAASQGRSASNPSKPTNRSEARLSRGVRVGGSEDNQWRRRSHEVSRRSVMSSSAAHSRRSLSSDHSGHTLRPFGAALSATSNGSVSGNGDDGLRTSMTGFLKRVRPGKDGRTSSKTQPDDDSMLARVDATAATGNAKHAPAIQQKTTTVGNQHIQEPSSLAPIIPDLPVVCPAYLLVSLPLGLATNLATMSLSSPSVPSAPFKRRQRNATSTSSSGSAKDDGEDGAAIDVSSSAVVKNAAQGKMVSNPTMAIYGDSDSFLSNRKIQQWTAKMTDSSRAFSHPPGIPLFQAHMVPTAGHFWTEGRTFYELQDTIDGFLDGLVKHTQKGV